VVLSAGWDGGGGRTVKLRHPNTFMTAYLHLSRFEKGIRPGVRVVQGQIIGFVGSSGLATGPHLDYRVQHRGKWIDPTTLKEQPSEPISSQQMASFVALRDQLREELAAGAFGDGDDPAATRLASAPAGTLARTGGGS
jgi:murein DD-endopeptidase MepM/ murein hydrolase activator NlpD